MSNAARTAITALLAGNAPGAVNLADLGEYQHVYTEMLRAYLDAERAHRGSGATVVRQVFNGCAVTMPALIPLIAGTSEREKRRTAYTAAELLAAQFPPIKWVVPGLIPLGLTILAGRPKMGKSWLTLQIATAVGSGGMVLGRRVDQSRVLYLALEDSERRIQDRLLKQRADAGALIDFRFDWRPLAAEGMNDLATEIDRGGYKLIVIDTISRALGRADQMNQADMNVTMGLLQRITLDRGVTTLLVDHHRKSAGFGGDVIDDVMGATSKAAVADAALGLYRERGDKDATLKITGRDIEDCEIAIGFDRELGCWQPLGDATTVKADSVQAQIMTAIEEIGGRATAKQVADWLKRDRSNVYAEMQELVAKGKLERTAKVGKEVFYSFVDDDAEG
jgi:hypothetical protein